MQKWIWLVLVVVCIPSLAVNEQACGPMEVLLDVNGGSNRRAFQIPKGETRFAISVLVVLANGKRVLGLGGAVSAQHDDLIHAIERVHGQKVIQVEWGGELQLRNSGGSSGGVGEIVSANETSGYLFKTLKVPSDIEKLKTAIKGSKEVTWNVPANRPVRHGEAPEHLHPGMSNRHDRNNFFYTVEAGLDAVLFRIGNEDEDWLEGARSYGTMALTRIDPLKNLVDLMVDDGVVTKAEADSLIANFKKYTDHELTKPEEFKSLYKTIVDFRQRLDAFHEAVDSNMTMIELP